MTEEAKNKTSAKIAEINDRFRKQNPMRYLITSGVLAQCSVMDIRYAVRHFSAFTEDNDPYGEHDFGSMKLNDEKLFWKIDYYDPSFELWCDPLHPECERVLTVMLAEEY